MPIPKIIHIFYKEKLNQLPLNYQQNVDKWHELHPNYKINIYDQQKMYKYIEKYYPEFKQLYNSFNSEVQVNFGCCALLHREGGIYANINTFPVKSFDDLLNSNRIILASEAVEHCERYKRGQVLCNAIMLSPPENSFWYRFMTYIQDHNLNNSLALTEFIEQNPIEADQVNILPSCYFYPLLNSNYHKHGITQKIGNKTFTNVSKLCDPSKTYAIHNWDNTESQSNLFLIIFTLAIILILLIFIIIIINRK